MGTITIDRDERAILYRELERELSGAGDDLAHAQQITRDQAEDAITRARFAFATFDAIGWDEDDDERELPADAELEAWLLRLREGMADTLAYEHCGLAHLEAGDEHYCSVGCSREVSIARRRDVIALWKADLAIVDSLLDRLDQQIDVVA